MSLSPWTSEEVATYHHYLNDHPDRTALPARIAELADKCAGTLNENLRYEGDTDIAVAGDDRFMVVEMSIFDMLLKSNKIKLADLTRLIQ